MDNKWKVPYNYLPQQFNSREDIFDEWKKLAETSEFTLGPKVKEFEENFARYVGAQYCIATNNGTDALILALKAFGIKKGDEVITVPNSFYATTGAIVNCGAKPVFVDVDSNHQMDAEQIENAITKNTRAILPVYWGGSSPDMLHICEITKRHSLVVIEDACMGIGGKHKEIPHGRFGNIGAFSMHPLKSLNVMGDGGMLVTDDLEKFKWMSMYRNHGMTDRDHIKIWGVNMRIQPIQAIVASLELPKIDQIIISRNKNAEFLDAELKQLTPYIKIPHRHKYDLNTYSLYMVQCEKRDELLNHLRSKSIDAKIHYPVPLHLQDAAKSLGYSRGSFPIAESQAVKIITLPVHQFLDLDQLTYMVDCVKDFYSRIII